MTSPKVQTPRPTPLFFQPPLSFSTKKERGQTPKVVPPPRPPIKSAPPLSRIFPRKQLLKAVAVSFKSPEKSIQSPHYNASNKELFFDQCFDIECKIGVGSFGEFPDDETLMKFVHSVPDSFAHHAQGQVTILVFKVRSKEDGRLYAVKRSRQRFRGECDRLRKLEEVDKHETLPSHPNCVGFVKAWEEKGHLYIQTELCKMSLNVFAEENHSIPEEVIWNYFVDLLMALQHLHEHDLVHMDIKPENIFISADNVCKLGDFGLVLDLKKEFEVRDAQEGDPKYLAPELMMGQFGKPADIFSLGITILEIASDLDLPRGGDLWHKLRSGVMPEEFLSGVSGELKEIIRGMMEPDPTKRPTIKQVLEHEYVEQIWQRRLAEVSQLRTASPISVITPQGTELSSGPFMTPSSEESTKHPPDWDYSFSDDEGSSLASNSFGMILDFSTSSDDSMKAFSNFPNPSLLPRMAYTTPRYKRKRGAENQSDSSKTPPLFKHCDDVYSSSPVNTNSVGIRSIMCGEKLTTPSPIAPCDMDVDDVQPDRISVEPKNLMKAFESILCDEAPD